MQFITITGLLDRIVARIEGAWINGVIAQPHDPGLNG